MVLTCTEKAEELPDVYFHRYSGWRMVYSPAVSDQPATSRLLNADSFQWIAGLYGSRLEAPEVTLYRVSRRLSIHSLRQNTYPHLAAN